MSSTPVGGVLTRKDINFINRELVTIGSHLQSIRGLLLLIPAEPIWKRYKD